MRMKCTAALAATLMVLAGCSSKAPDKPPDKVAACKAAMRADYERSLTDPNAPTATRPPACNGIDDATLERLVGEVMTEVTPPEPTTT
jgi:PBP1b-binding outer membrane lipoprotein LpoB